jgi:hypothetical protein
MVASDAARWKVTRVKAPDSLSGHITAILAEENVKLKTVKPAPPSGRLGESATEQLASAIILSAAVEPPATSTNITALEEDIILLHRMISKSATLTFESVMKLPSLDDTRAIRSSCGGGLVRGIRRRFQFAFGPGGLTLRSPTTTVKGMKRPRRHRYRNRCWWPHPRPCWKMLFLLDLMLMPVLVCRGMDMEARKRYIVINLRHRLDPFCVVTQRRFI